MLTPGAHADDAAAILAPGRSTLTYGELTHLIARVGSQLRAAGISREDRVVLLAPNGPEAATAFLSLAGTCQCAPLNPAYRDAELTFYFEDLKPKLIIHSSDTPPPAARQLNIPAARLQIDQAAPAGAFSLPDLPSPAGLLQGPLRATALLLHTSGTTSRPKLVPLTWDNLRNSARNIGSTLRLTAADRCLNVMPLFHIHGIVAALLSTLGSGGSVVCTPGLVAPSFFDWMDEFAPTWYTAVPTLHQSILERAPRHADAIRRSHLRFIRSSSAPLPVMVLAELEATFHVPVIEAYGMTEAAHQMSSNPLPPAVRKAGSVGQAAGPDVAVLDADGAAVAPGDEGFVCIRGSNVTPGYLGSEIANRESFRHGWFYTGDLGRMDEDGYLWLTGRSKEILNRGGEKISPREVDDVLMTHPAIRQCLTFALPDSQLGEEVGAAVVFRAGAMADEAEIQRFAAARLSDFKVPRRVFALDEIPAGPTGKLQRVGMAGRMGITADSWKPRQDRVAPIDASTTKAVSRIMCSVLDVLDLDDDTGFFDAGGDSLLASRLIVRLEGEFGRTLSIVDLFRASSANAIAARLLTAAPATAKDSLVDAGGPPAISAGQRRLWLHDQLDEDGLASQSPRLFEILAAVHPDRVREALVRIIERHEPLRTVIHNDGGTPRAELRPIEPFSWTVHDWTSTPAEQREASAREICVREASRPFQLDADLMMRASLHHLGGDRWWLFVLMHHSAIDGWSTQLLRAELQTLLEGGTPAPLLARYSDFARWQLTAAAGDVDALKDYWVRQLDGLPPALELPLDFPRPAVPSHRGRAVSALLPRAMTSALGDLGRRHQATLFMTLLSGWISLLSRYTGATDFCVGTPVAGRGKVEFESLIGLFMNTLVLRTRLEGDPSFAGVIARVRETCLAAWEHDLPFEHVLQAVPHDRTAGHAPFFQVFFQLRNFPRATTSAVVPITELDIDVDVVPADLNLEITETPAGLRCRLQYNTALFTERFATAMLDHFEALLAGAIAEPDTALSRLPVMGARERATLVSGRLPLRRPAAATTIVELFEQQAASRATAIAILHRDRRLTYGELNADANRMARVLTSNGVGPEHIVALCMPRSPEWIVAMLAVAKAGGAYMSLEADYPAALIHDLIARSRAALVLADDRCRHALAGIATRVIWTSELPALLADSEDGNPPLAATPGNLAHVFFTSGSTGRPKGVATEHRNLSAFLAWHHWMPHGPAETCLQFTSVTFDPAAAEVWGPLTRGGRCAIYAEGLDDPARLGEWIRGTGVTMCYLSTSVFNTLIDEAPDVLRTVRRILIGGEALSVPHIRRALDLLPRSELINGYGPTETTVYYTGYRIPRPFDPARTSVPIGRPLDNGCAYIVDRDGQLVPDGLPGELWIGGDTVGRGYLHEPALTAAAFPAAPAGDAAARVYRTGDRARWLPDGELEFLGRIDHQVKVRGVRIELGEIETVVREHPSVAQACVVAQTHPAAGTVLTAFVALRDGAAASAADLRAYLAGRLSHQMVPARLHLRESLPLTPSGKIDRAALTRAAGEEPQPGPTPSPAPARAPRTERAAPSPPDLEAQLAAIWRELLGVGDVGPDDNFFALGGHSLLAVRLAFQIERRFGTHVTLLSLFEASTLSGMAALIRGEGTARPAAARVESAASLPPILCVAAGPLFHAFANALAPACLFQSIPTPTHRESIATMEELAAQIVPSILTAHRHGPLIIAGWSLAGVVAIEVAAQLERAGREVKAVILFDTVSPVRQRQWFAPSPRLRQWQLNLIKLRYHLEEALTLGPRQSWRYLVNTFRDARARTEYDRVLRTAPAGGPGSFDVPLDFRQVFGVYAARYSPAPLRARVIVVRPERQKRGAFFSGDLGWGELGYRVSLLIVPGDHERMFAPPNAAVLAERLLAKLSLQTEETAMMSRRD
jgi:amino acid adenylation domain-containing protein